MSDFEPTTDFPEFVDPDEQVVESTAAMRDAAIQHRRTQMLRGFCVVLALALVAWGGFGRIRPVIAVAAFYVLMKAGMGIAGAFARPIPEAPPSGELRKVKLTYRCDHCGTEIRMTRSNDQVPEAPRHCTDDMILTTNLEDIL